MASILFTNQPSVGHLNTLLTIALQMRAEGHDVRFLIPGVKRNHLNLTFSIVETAFAVPRMLERHGLAYDLLAPPLATVPLAIRLPLTEGYEEISLAVDLFTVGVESYARRIAAHLEQTRPDVVVTDFAFPAAYLAAERVGIPAVTVFHSGLPFKGALVPPFGSGLPIGQPSDPRYAEYAGREQVLMEKLNGRLRRAERALGLAADVLRQSLFAPYSRWLNLVTSVEAVEAPRDTTTDTTFYIGPCFSARRGRPSDFPFDQLRADRCKVYVSLGTVFNNRPQIYRAIIEALDDPAYQVIVSAGKSYDALSGSALPDNVMLFRSVPQVDLLPKVDLVIGHGGNNSTNETLAAGKPLLVIPVGGEQGDNASRVEYLGAGLRLPLREVTAERVHAQVAVLRDTPSFRVRAEALSAAIAESDGPRAASHLIAQLAATRQPVRRPPGTPLTITRDLLANPEIG